jgi:hypothetical protein
MGCAQTKEPHRPDNHILPNEKFVMDSEGNEIQDVSPSIDDILRRINNN